MCDVLGEEEGAEPESEIFNGVFGALLLMVSVPVAFPEAFGSKFTVYCAV